MVANYFLDDEEVELTRSVKAHWNKNNVNREEVDLQKEAESLIDKPCDYKNIFGYISEKDGKKSFVKYNKEKEVYVNYKLDGKIICSKIMSWREYEGSKYDTYYGEIE